MQYLRNFRAQNNAAEIVPVPPAVSDSEESDSEEEIESVPRVVSVLRLHLNALPDLVGNIAAPASNMGLPPPVTDNSLSNRIIINRIHSRLLHFLARPGDWANSGRGRRGGTSGGRGGGRGPGGGGGGCGGGSGKRGPGREG